MTFAIDPKLAGIDRVGKRWGRSDAMRQQLHPIERMRLLHEGQVLGSGGDGDKLPGDVAAWIDAHMLAPKETQYLLKVWYCGPAPIFLKAQRCGCSRATLYRRWEQALVFMQAELKKAGHHV